MMKDDRLMGRGNQSVSHCPIANKSEDADEIAKHMWLFCDECRSQRIRKLLQRKPLYGLREEPTNVQHNLTENSNRPKRERIAREREQEEEKQKKDETFIPDGLQISRLMKAGITKREAVQKFVDEKRKEAMKKKAKELEGHGDENNSEETANKKLKVDPSNLPWTPRYDKFLLHNVSKLPRVVDHQRYVAIISNFLDTNKTLRYDHNRQEIKAMDEKLADEREQFQEYVQKRLNSIKQRLYLSENVEANRFVLNRLMKRRCAHLHDQYGSAVKVITSANDKEGGVTLKLKYNLLSGWMPKLIIPNERRKFAFSNDCELIGQHFTADKCDQLPLESDELAEHLALKYGVNIIIGVSSILSIVCREWLYDSPNYVIPISVKYVFDKNTARTKKICVVGKRCVVDEINYPSLWRRFLRYSVDIALHQTQKTSLKTGGRQRSVMSKIGKTEQTSSDMQKESDSADGLMTIDDSSSRKDERNEETDWNAGMESSGRGEADNNNASSEHNEGLVEDVLAGIMKEMGSTTSAVSGSNEFEGAMEQGSVGLSEYKGVDLSKRYSIFEFSGESHENDLNILIRSGNDGIDVQSGTSVSLAVKPEFLADFGAERLNDEEWLHDVMRCTFKGASHLIRLRIHHSELHFLQKERYELRTLITREDKRRILYSKRMEFLKSVLHELENLQSGNYALRMNGNDAEILPELTVDPSSDTSEKIEINLKKQDGIKVSRAIGFPFEGIDEHVALVYHLLQKRIPAAFLPERPNKWKGGESAKTSKNQASSAPHPNASKNKKRSRKRGERKWKRNKQNTNNNNDNDSNKQPAAKRKRTDLDAPQ